MALVVLRSFLKSKKRSSRSWIKTVKVIISMSKLINPIMLQLIIFRPNGFHHFPVLILWFISIIAHFISWGYNNGIQYMLNPWWTSSGNFVDITCRGYLHRIGKKRGIILKNYVVLQSKIILYTLISKHKIVYFRILGWIVVSCIYFLLWSNIPLRLIRTYSKAVLKRKWLKTGYLTK